MKSLVLHRITITNGAVQEVSDYLRAGAELYARAGDPEAFVYDFFSFVLALSTGGQLPALGPDANAQLAEAAEELHKALKLFVPHYNRLQEILATEHAAVSADGAH